MQPQLTRRRAIGGAAGIAGAASIGGLGLLAFSPAAATTSNLTINDTSIENDTGELQFVDVDVDVRIEWTGFEVDVHHLKFVEFLDIVLEDGTEVVVDHKFFESGIASLADHEGSDGDDAGGRNQTSDPGTSGWIEAGAPFRVAADDGVDPYHAEVPYRGDGDLSALEPDVDGGEVVASLTFSKFVRLYDADKNPLTGPNGPSWGPDDALVEGHFDVTVTDTPSDTSSSGDGTSSTG